MRQPRSLPAVILLAMAALVLAVWSPQAKAQSTEDRFHDLFVTAGYATAFGAALGAAALSFTTQPEQHLKFVAIGASLGFIGGSAMGTYLVFSPILIGSTKNQGHPAWTDIGLQAQVNLASF